jgi:hypothetical protein
MDSPVQASPFQAVGRFSGRISAAAIIDGGGHNLAFAFNTPAGMGSPKILAGPERSHKVPFSTAAAMDFSRDPGVVGNAVPDIQHDQPVQRSIAEVIQTAQ